MPATTNFASVNDNEGDGDPDLIHALAIELTVASLRPDYLYLICAESHDHAG